MKKTYMINNYITIANDFRDQGQYVKALKFYNKAYNYQGGNENIELILNMAIFYDEIGEVNIARDKYYEVLQLDENEPRAYYGLGILADDREDYTEAIKYFKTAIYHDNYYAKAFFFLANAYDNVGEHEKSIENYKKVIELDADDFWAHINIGAIYEDRNNLDEALYHMKNALDIIPDHHIALFNLGVIYKKLNNLKMAMTYYKDSINAYKNYPFSYLNLAIIYKEAGDYKRAIKILDEAIKHNPEVSVLYYNRGCCKVNINELELALRDIIQSCELNLLLIDYVRKDEELDPIKELEAYDIFFNNK